MKLDYVSSFKIQEPRLVTNLQETTQYIIQTQDAGLADLIPADKISDSNPMKTQLKFLALLRRGNEFGTPEQEAKRTSLQESVVGAIAVVRSEFGGGLDQGVQSMSQSNSNIKRSIDKNEDEESHPPVKFRRMEDNSSSSSSSNNGDSTDEDDDSSSSKSSSYQSSSSTAKSSSSSSDSERVPEEDEQHIKELADMLHDEDSKSEFVFPSTNESSSKVLHDDIFDDLMHYDASVAEAITNNHLESNRELIDRQMGLFEEENELEGGESLTSSFTGTSSSKPGSSPPPPPVEPPPQPPPPPPLDLPPLPADVERSLEENSHCDKEISLQNNEDLSVSKVKDGELKSDSKVLDSHHHDAQLPITMKECYKDINPKYGSDNLLNETNHCQSPSAPNRLNPINRNIIENKKKKKPKGVVNDPPQNGIKNPNNPRKNIDSNNECPSLNTERILCLKSTSSKPNLIKCLGDTEQSVHETVSDDDFDEEELDALVNGDVTVRKQEEQEEPTIAHEERIKIILDDLTHSSGMPIYLHRPSRVVSLSKPYFLGKGSVKHHAIPVSSIPCLSYKRGLEEEAEAKKRLEAELNDPDKLKNGCPIFPKARVQSIEEFAVSESLNSEQFREFCKGRFIFKELRIKKFNNWTDRRKFQKQVVKKSLKAAIDKTKQSLANDSSLKDIKNSGIPEIKSETYNTNPNKERPTLPEGTKVLSVPMIELEPLDGNSDNASALNQKCLKTQPTYRFEEMESSATPYSATVIINGMEYGRGFGTSKKIAKRGGSGCTRFIYPRVNELCSRTSEPSPYTILLNCLQRNYGLGDLNITTELKPLRNKKNEFTMRVDKREVKVVCKNKRDGKQLASQKLLQLLHPHVKSWGSLLSLYGNRAARIQKVKKAKESEVTELQSRSSADAAPSIAILEKLRKEMLNLRAARNAMAPIGKFVMPLSSTTPSGCKIERINL
ncbi:DCGR8 [Lepeophtheirus salmonis]|uniref:DCGR8 n=1 Tax=Lepeophtheirus salmonis TaxID=72036 RepID=A0A7R8H7I8_LEPSM|nr:DCGR8 [Lepeophtheirus salmonis]CAF2924226.1 DCGR8 [Lepeophtheirus salmonis]